MTYTTRASRYIIALWAGIMMWCSASFATVVQPIGDGFGSVKPVVDAGIAIAGTDGNPERSIEDVIKWFVNRTLGILWLVALLMLLYGWFKMVTAMWWEWFSEWFSILKNAALGLVVIGVAWFVVSLVFFVLNLVTENAGEEAGTVSNVWGIWVNSGANSGGNGWNGWASEGGAIWWAGTGYLPQRPPATTGGADAWWSNSGGVTGATGSSDGLILGPTTWWWAAWWDPRNGRRNGGSRVPIPIE